MFAYSDLRDTAAYFAAAFVTAMLFISAATGPISIV